MRRFTADAIPTLVAAAGLFLAGCGQSPAGPEVASLTPSATPSPSSSSAPAAGGSDPLAYSKCMREHGISDFPDPNSSGGFTIKNEPGSDLDPTNPRYQAAADACKALAPQRPDDTQNDREADLKFSQCIREHGVPDFPDPDSDGHIAIGKPGEGSDPNSDLDPDNPTLKAAQQACSQYLPGGGDQQPVGGAQGNG